MSEHTTVEQWVALFRETGLDEAMMHKWHHLFEARHPAAHQAFLEWLGLPAEKIEKIRVESR